MADALDLKAEDRPAFLDRACSSDDLRRREVEQLLSSSDKARSSFLQFSLFCVGLSPGTKLGDYEVQRLLGSGGMVEVYRAPDVRLVREVFPLSRGAIAGHVPNGFQSEAELAKAPGVVFIGEFDSPAQAPQIYTFARMTVQRNLFRAPIS